MGRRKRSRTVDVSHQNCSTSTPSNTELEQRVVTHSATQSGPPNDTPLSDHELSEGKLIYFES